MSRMSRSSNTSAIGVGLFEGLEPAEKTLVLKIAIKVSIAIVRTASATVRLTLTQIRCIAPRCPQIADIGNAYAPWEAHMAWNTALEREFFKQGQMELDAGLTPGMLKDPNKPGVSTPANQIAFFQLMALPLVRAWAQVFPSSGHKLLEQALSNLKKHKHADGTSRPNESLNSIARPNESLSSVARSYLSGSGQGHSNRVVPV